MLLSNMVGQVDYEEVDRNRLEDWLVGIAPDYVGVLKASTIIHDLHIYPQFRNRGEGKKLMRQVIELVGDGPIYLNAIPEPPTPLAKLVTFYQDVGFEMFSSYCGVVVMHRPGNVEHV